MITKLTKHGNSLALVVPKSILELLNWDPKQEVKITTNGKRLIITPYVLTDISKMKTVRIKNPSPRAARVCDRCGDLSCEDH